MKQARTFAEARYRRTMSDIGLTMILFFVIFYISVFSLQFIYELLYLYAPLPERILFLIYQLTYGALYLLSFMLPVLVLRVRTRNGVFEYRPMYAAPKISGYLPLMIFAVIMLVRAASYLNSLWASIAFPFDSFYSASAPVAMEGFEIILQFLVTCLVPGFCEEFLFRGAILTNCMPFGRTNAIIISSLLFSMMHANIYQMLYTFVAGILLGLVYEKTGSIWNCVILHVLNNFFAVIDEVIYANLTAYSVVLTTGVECIICLLGVISLAILIRRFFSKKSDLSEGIYQKELSASDDFATCPLTTARAVKLFFTPSIIAFTVLTLISTFFL